MRSETAGQLLLLVLAAASSRCCHAQQQQQQQPAADCPHGWAPFRSSCYLRQPSVVSFLEANFYCAARNSQLTSIADQAETEFLAKLTGGQAAWIDLIEVNPCSLTHQLAPASTSTCYQWLDRSGLYNSVPTWHQGHPVKIDGVPNCVALHGHAIKTESCLEKHLFVCKSKVTDVFG